MQRVRDAGNVSFASRDVSPGSPSPNYFTNGTPGTQAPTKVPGYFLNMVQDELTNLPIAAGMTPDDTSWCQVYQAILTMGQLADTGSLNALAASPPALSTTVPGASGLADGFQVSVTPANSISVTNPTFAWNGGSGITVTDPFGNALATNAIVKGKPATLRKMGGGSPTWWLLNPVGRVALSQAVTLYMGGTGASDSNDGLAATVTGGHGPWATFTKAAAYIEQLDTLGYSVTLNVANGTYTAGFVLSNPPLGGGTINVIGNVGSPTSCIVSTTNGPCFTLEGGVTVSVSGFELTAGGGTVGQRYGLLAIGGTINFNNIAFGLCSDGHIASANGGSINGIGSTYSIIGNAANHVNAGAFGQINIDGANITMTGSLAFNQFALANEGHVDGAFNSITGSYTATGERYLAENGGYVNSAGGGANWFPGNSAGSATTGYYA